MSGFSLDQRINLRGLYARQGCPHFHLDAQSGTQAVLDRMYRLFGRRHYRLWR